ncbi:MAG: hypothetical protein ABI725_01575 [Chloroflexota bacterium]
MDRVVTSNIVTLQSVTDTFSLDGQIAWKVDLTLPVGTRTIYFTIIDSATGRTVSTKAYAADAGSWTYYGKTSLVSEPGTYVMQYSLDTGLIGEGQFTVTKAAPTEDPNAGCDPSYPTVCIPPWPPDLDCKDIPFTNFEVDGLDMHNFDGDFDGIGCESGGGGGGPKPTKKPNNGGGGGGGSNCDPSYPTLCLPSSPDLDCGDINARNFPVVGRDPHGFDGDNDGIGCET